MAQRIHNAIYEVSENQGVVRTNFPIRDGDRLVFSASGTIWAGVWFTGENGPQGWDNISNNNKFPLRSSHPYCLFAKIGENQFYVGRGTTFCYTGSGDNLELWINDDVYGNGNGAFSVSVQVWR